MHLIPNFSVTFSPLGQPVVRRTRADVPSTLLYDPGRQNPPYMNGLKSPLSSRSSSPSPTGRPAMVHRAKTISRVGSPGSHLMLPDLVRVRSGSAPNSARRERKALTLPQLSVNGQSVKLQTELRTAVSKLVTSEHDRTMNDAPKIVITES